MMPCGKFSACTSWTAGSLQESYSPPQPIHFCKLACAPRPVSAAPLLAGPGQNSNDINFEYNLENNKNNERAIT